MERVGATGEFHHDAGRQLNRATPLQHFQPHVNAVVDQVLGVDSGLEEKREPNLASYSEEP